MLRDINEDGVYRLAAAVVKGLPAAERAQWLDVGRAIQERLATTSPAVRAARPGHMATIWGESDGRKVSARGRRRGSAPISARMAGRQ